MEKLSKDEIINNLKTALLKYADPIYWHGNQFVLEEDINCDRCAGNYLKNGEVARQALQYNDGMQEVS